MLTLPELPGHTDLRDTFEQVYRANFALVYHYAKRMIGDSQVAEDIATEAFLGLWKRFPDFSAVEQMRQYLLVTARNGCLDHLRDEGRLKSREQGYAYLVQENDNSLPFSEEIRGQVYRYIYSEIEKLPPQEKKVFKMAYLEGLSNEEIAARLSIHNQSVRNHKARALKTLRIALSGKELYGFLLLLTSFTK